MSDKKPRLFCVLGLDELQRLLNKFRCQVDMFAPDSLLFKAECRRLTEEIKVLIEKAECWDVLRGYGRTFTSVEATGLRLERDRIMSSLRFLEGHLQLVYDKEKADPGPNAPLGTGNDLIYSSASSDSSSTGSAGSNKENVFRPIPVVLAQQQPPQPHLRTYTPPNPPTPRPSSPGNVSVYSNTSSSSCASSSIQSYHYHDVPAVVAQEEIPTYIEKPKCCRELRFSTTSGSSISSIGYEGPSNLLDG